MVAQSQFSHKELQGLSCEQMQHKLITERDINWNNLTSAQKQGVYVHKESFKIHLDQDKLDKIPIDKRPDGGIVTRSKIVEIDMPNFHKVINPVEVIFDGAKPIFKE